MQLDDLKTGLRDAVEQEPAADPTAGRRATDHRARQHQTRRVAAIALCIALVAVVVGLRVARRGTDEQGYTTNTGDLPKFVATDLPAGLQLAAKLDPGSSALVTVDAHITVYARGSKDPRGDSFAVLTMRYPAVARGTEVPGAPGTTAAPSHGTPDPTQIQTAPGGLRVAASATAAGDWRLAVMSHVVPDGGLTKMAQVMVPRDDGSIDPAQVPDGYAPIASSDRIDFAYATAGIAPVGSGYELVYRAAGPESPTAVLDVRQGSAADLTVARFLLPDPQERTIRGRPGLSATQPIETTSSSLSSASVSGTIDAAGATTTTTTPPTTRVTVTGSLTTVTWLENDGTLVTLWGHDVSVDELVRLAEGLRDDATAFDRALAATTTTALPPGCVERPGGGRACTSTGTVIGSGTVVGQGDPIGSGTVMNPDGSVEGTGTAVPRPTSDNPSATTGSASTGSASASSGAVSPR